MARPLGLELAGVLYHVTSRGDGREDIFLSDEDRLTWLATLTRGVRTFQLRVDFVPSQFAAQRARAIAKYVAFVHEGARLPSVWRDLQGQVYLGSEAFVRKMQALVDAKPDLTENPRSQRPALKRALSDFAGAHPRDEAIARAYLSGQHTMAAIAKHFGVHYTTVSRVVKAFEQSETKVMR
jgi:putative transposase